MVSSPVAGEPSSLGAELARERDALAKSKQDIAEGEERIDRQRRVLAQVRRQGVEPGPAERLLALLEETLEGWRQHQELIIERIAYLEERSLVAEANIGRCVAPRGA